MPRIFVYDGRKLDDPDPDMSIEKVRETYADFFGDLVNATWQETTDGEDTIYTFQRRVGTKGRQECRKS